MARVPAPRNPVLGARRNGWLIVCHPAFRDPLIRLRSDVEQLRAQDPDGFVRTAKAKLLKRILDVILTEVPANPGSLIYEQGNTLGADARGWRRVSFLNRLRLFFRFDSTSRVIVYAWLNDEHTLRKAGSATDCYAVFRRMLVSGDPPHGWQELLDACRVPSGAGLPEALGAVLGELGSLPEPVAVDTRVTKKKRKR